MLGAMHQAFKVAAFGGFSGIAGLLVAWRWIGRMAGLLPDLFFKIHPILGVNSGLAMKAMVSGHRVTASFGGSLDTGLLANKPNGPVVATAAKLVHQLVAVCPGSA